MAIVKTYAEKILEVSTEKVLLAHVEPSQRAVTWTLHSGAVYKRATSYFVIDTKVSATSLTEGASATLAAGGWYYDSEEGYVYVRMSDDSSPQDSFVSLTYRFFFADAPVVLTYDLTDSITVPEVEYDCRIENDPSFPQEIDSTNQLGISLESSGSITLMNKDGYFEAIFDKLFWENKRVALYSWFPDTQFSEAQQIFEGIIQDKTYTEDTVSFKVQDLIYKLRWPLDLGMFSASDGNISDDVIGTPKRRLYGEVKGVACQTIDQLLEGFDITGTIAGTAASATITGSGTSFLSELSPGDVLTFTVLGAETTGTIDSIESDTSLTLSENVTRSFSGIAASSLPEIPYHAHNRTWHLAGHKLREPSTTITAIDQPNRVTVADASDMAEGDAVYVNSVVNEIKRIFGNDLVLLQNLVTPTIGQTVVRNPIRNVYFNRYSFSLTRDYTLTNTTEAKIVFNASAEFNVTPRRKIIGTPTFTNASRDVTGSGTKFLNDFSPRDWVVSGDITHQTWYEILSVTDDENMILRTAYAGGTTSSGTPGKKNVTYFDDNSVVVVDTVGMENVAGDWVKTASDVVKDIMNNDAGITNLDTDSFTQADDEAPYTVAIKFPLDKGGSLPTIRDAINLINKSVLGSLVSQTDATIAFSILSPEKPTTLSELNDDDLTGPIKVETRTNIVRSVNGQYNFFDADVYTGEPGHSLVETTNTTTFVDNLVGSEEIMTVQIHLFNASDAEIVAETYAFLHSLTQSVVTVTAKLNLALNNINDKIFLGLDRLYQRFGSTAQKKIGIISKIVRSGQSTTVKFTDLSGIFNRVANISSDTASDFDSATETEKILYGYVVDDDTELPDSSATTDDEYGINLIG